MSFIPQAHHAPPSRSASRSSTASGVGGRQTRALLAVHAQPAFFTPPFIRSPELERQMRLEQQRKEVIRESNGRLLPPSTAGSFGFGALGSSQNNHSHGGNNHAFPAAPGSAIGSSRPPRVVFTPQQTGLKSSLWDDSIYGSHISPALAPQRWGGAPQRVLAPGASSASSSSLATAAPLARGILHTASYTQLGGPGNHRAHTSNRAPNPVHQRSVHELSRAATAAVTLRPIWPDGTLRALPAARQPTHGSASRGEDGRALKSAGSGQGARGGQSLEFVQVRDGVETRGDGTVGVTFGGPPRLLK